MPKKLLKPIEESKQDIKVWDVKRVLLGVVLILILLGVAFYSLGPKIATLPSFSYHPAKKTVMGISDKDLQNPSVDVNQKVAAIKQEMQAINVQDIATNSPQVQKVMQDLQALQNYPKVQTKDVCEQICKGL